MSHALTLGLRARLTREAPLPEDFLAVIDKLGSNYELEL